MWVVRNANVSVQARYLPDDDLDPSHLFVRALAVGGEFLGGNLLLIGALDGKITWNAQEILSEENSKFDVPGLMKARRHLHSHHVENKSATNPGVDVDLPLGIKLTVNRQQKHVNLDITMSPLAGGQDGLCGNFNGIAADDTIEMIRSRDFRVAPGETLFPKDKAAKEAKAGDSKKPKAPKTAASKPDKKTASAKGAKASAKPV